LCLQEDLSVIALQNRSREFSYTADEAFITGSVPFLTALLFTTENDITFKLNKKKSIVEQAPTFKNAGYF
jgi:hypothetical protein